jgi:hypothetical protein
VFTNLYLGVGIARSQITFSLFSADCLHPPSPLFGDIISLVPSTTEGSTIVYQCKDGYIPRNSQVAECGSDGQWNPDPTMHRCTCEYLHSCIEAEYLHSCIEAEYLHSCMHRGWCSEDYTSLSSIHGLGCLVPKPYF